MLPGSVAIHAPVDTPSAWLLAATQACQAALGEGRCVADSAEATVAWRAVVTVPADGSEPNLRIELYDLETDELESTRLLQFKTLDPQRQRWASAGVVVAAMVSAEEARRAIQPPPPSIEPAPTVTVGAPTPAPPAPPVAEVGQLWFDGALRVANGFDGGVSLGGRLGMTARPFQFGWLFGLRAHGAWQGGSANSTWVGVDGAFGVRLVESERLAWDLLATVGAEQYRVTLERRQQGIIETDAGARWRVGAGAETTLGWRLVGPWSAFGTLAGAAYLPEISVTQQNEPLGRLWPSSFSVSGGLRWVASSRAHEE